MGAHVNNIKNEKLTDISQVLRSNMTKEEKHLWYDFLKLLPITVNRQKVIGKYIADFYCAGAKIVIEIDGGQHYEEEARKKDQIRDAYFAEIGITVLRYTNLDIHRNFNGVCADIINHIEVATGEKIFI